MNYLQHGQVGISRLLIAPLLSVPVGPVSLKHPTMQLLDVLRIVNESVTRLGPVHDSLVRNVVLVTMRFKDSQPALEPEQTALILGHKQAQKRVERPIAAYEFHDVERVLNSAHTI